MKLEYKIINEKYYNVKDVLKSYFEISDRLLIKLKKNNRILLNNVPTYVNSIVHLNDIISVNLDFEEESENIVQKPMELKILFEDETLLIINKPPNMPVHPSMSHFKDSLSNGVKYYFDTHNIKRKIRPVNRLDKDTSGIVIFAKNEYVQEILIKQMKSNIFKKEYYAILNGHLENRSGIISAPIARKENSIIERTISESGEISITHYELIRNYNLNNNVFTNYNNIVDTNTGKNTIIKNQTLKLAFVKFILETGRTHQIRVHSKYIGHPILGDSLYGNSSDVISRQALHGYKVTFLHPIKKNKLVFEVELPFDMMTILN